MNDDNFEWDDAKAAANLAAHGVTFESARQVFKDVFAVEWLDDRYDYGEDRFNIIGMADNRLLVVSYTQRNGVRIISARGAEPHEKRRYHEDNQS